MKSKFTWIFTLFMVLAVQIVSAQEKTVTGTVTDADFGDPIPGVSVLLEGTQYGTETDMDGKYSINARPGQRLVFKFTGFADMYMTVGQSNVLNAVMAESVDEEIEELVIDAYRTMSAKETAIAQTTITSKTIEGRPNANIVQRLQGQVPGLNIMTGSGQPGSDDTSIMLRGVGTINGNSEPLFVIDGVPVSDMRFRSLNPNDFESVTVLKDAGATAIYGNRGANGVIVINTKKGSFDQDLSIKYTGVTGIASNQKDKYNLLDGPGLMRLEKFLYTETGGAFGSNYTDDAIANATTTDWMDVFFSPAIQQDHTLSFTVGSSNVASHTSIGYANYDGTLAGTNLQRFNFRTNLDGRSKDRALTYGVNVSANYSKNRMLDQTGSNLVYHNYFLGAQRGLPYISGEDYNWGETFDDVLNAYNTEGVGAAPLILIDRKRNVAYRQNELKFLVNGRIDYKLNENFSIGNQTGLDYQTIEQSHWYTPFAFHEVVSRASASDYVGYLSMSDVNRMVLNSVTNLKFQKTFNDDHTLKAGLYTEYIKGHYAASSLSRQGFDPAFWAAGTSSGAVSPEVDPATGAIKYAPGASSSKQATGLFSYFATAGYDYKGKYGIDGTIRRDASFRFTDDNKWGTFWSVSARWNISEEKFMEGSVFNDLKLRGSYGSTGNQDIIGSGLFGGAYLFATQYSTGMGYHGTPSIFISNLPNPTLKWETTYQANVGLDFGLWSNRLRGSVDFYNKTTEDLYLSRSIPAINGATSIPANFGTIENKGVDLMISGDVISTDNTRLTLNFVGGYNKNTVKEIPEEEGFFWNGSSDIGYKVGNPYAEFYMYDFLGYDDNGNLLYRSADGGTTMDPTDVDRFWTGKTMFPKFQGSFGFDFEYKGWFANVNFTYAQDVHRFDNDYFWYTHPAFVGDFNMSADYFDIWTPDNKGGEFPNPMAENFNDKLLESDFYLKDASYIRLRYATIGYNFGAQQLSFMKLSGLRVYAQAENLYTWTKWKGFDAEHNGSYDFAKYPTPKTVSFGLEVQF